MMLGVLLGQGFTAERRRKPAAFWILAVVALVLAAAALAGIAAAARADDIAADASTTRAKGERLLSLVNQARAESQLAALTGEARLEAAACGQARDLARGGPLSHRGSDGSDLADRVIRAGYGFAMAAENLMSGVPTPEETVWLWLGSPGHRRNILTPEFREAGIAHQFGPGGDVWVLVLAAPRATASQDQQRPAADPRGATDLGGDKALTCY